MLRVTDEHRRARIAARHGLGAPCPDAVAACRTMTALHATDPPSVHLAVHARVPGASPGDTEAALNQERSLGKVMAMRRTLWVMERDLLPHVAAGPGARVAGAERRRLLKELSALDPAPDAQWLQEAEAQVLAAVDEAPLTTAELAAALPTWISVSPRGSASGPPRSPCSPVWSPS